MIGSGVSGICAAIALRAAGIPFRVLEKSSSVGGTWLENRYPGCGVDTPSHLYSFSLPRRTGRGTLRGRTKSSVTWKTVSTGLA